MAYADLVTTPRDHAVFFYDVDPEMVDAVADYVAAGISAGEPVIIVVTAAHREAIDAVLAERGLNVSLARRIGVYLALDASETLDSFMVDGSPDADRFTSVVGGVIDASPAAGSTVRAFGEMVAVLWREGNVVGAIALESLWNDLAETRQFSLLCAYPTAALGAAELGEVNEVCHLHSAVHPPSSYGSASPGGIETGAAAHSRVFVAVPEAVAAARRFTRETLTSWGADHLVWEGELMISELATNAIIHGDSAFRTSIERAADAVRFAVEDVGPGVPRSRWVSEDALSGRGVAIVEELAQRWGFDRFDGGKVFWAELDVSSPRPGSASDVADRTVPARP